MDPQLQLPHLLARAAQGDRRSFGQFYELYLREIYRYILFQVNDHDEAEDLTARVFLEAWESLTGVRQAVQIKNIRAWIYRIAHNKVIDSRRTRRPQESIEDHEMKLESAWLEAEMDDVFISQNLADGIRQLPANYQEVIILRFINQMNHAEVAEIMNLTEGHVRVLQYRALEQMRKIVSEVNNE
jgi:RNA polymerase sigma-70 factor (ECF subfamily)